MTNSPSVTRTLPLAAGLLAGPLLIAIGTALDFTGGPPIESYLGRLDQARTAYLVGGLILWCGMALLPLTGLLASRAGLGRGRGTVLRVGAVFIAIWGILGVAGVGLGYTAGWVSVDLVGATTDDIVLQVFNGITYSPWGSIGGGGGSLAWLLGILGLGVGVLVARDLPRWPGVLLLVSPAFALVGGPLGLHWAASVGFVLLGVALAGLVPAVVAGSRAGSAAASGSPASTHAVAVSVAD